MPRPVSWLPRLHEIKRSVSGSARTHYDRRALQLLFKLQPSAASSLMEMLPKVEIGRAHMVEREALERFLNEAHAAEDVTALCIQQRAEKENVSRRQPRKLLLRDFEPMEPALLSRWLSRGHLEVNFETIQQLADVLWRIACTWTEEGDIQEFCRLYEPAPPMDAERKEARAERDALDRAIEDLEATRQAGLQKIA